jgi:hypothetical protein
LDGLAWMDTLEEAESLWRLPAIAVKLDDRFGRTESFLRRNDKWSFLEMSSVRSLAVLSLLSERVLS